MRERRGMALVPAFISYHAWEGTFKLMSGMITLDRSAIWASWMSAQKVHELISTVGQATSTKVKTESVRIRENQHFFNTPRSMMMC